MNNRSMNTLGAVLVSFMLVGLSACEKPAGPAEQAGKKLDEAATSAGQQVEKAGNRIQDAAKGEQK